MTSLPAEHRQFLDRLLALERGLAATAPEPDGLDDFRKHIIAPWNTLRWRLLGTTTERLRQMSPMQHALLDVLQNSPDLLAPLERDRDEMTHTRLIAWFLDRDGPVGDHCRHAVARHFQLDANTELVGVHTEVVVAKGCRVDLVVETRRHLIYIEAKVDADERPDQLADYRKALTANAGKRKPVLVFLTVDAPEHTSAEHVPLLFRELVAAWLPAVTLHGPDAAYLASYLVSVATALLQACEPQPFVHWPLRTQHRMLDLLQSIEDSDDR